MLCEYYISSNLGNKKKTSPIVSPTSVLLQLNKSSGKNATDNSLTTSTFSTTANSFESIEFIKYEKNPMDFLKSKYSQLNKAAQPLPVSLDKTPKAPEKLNSSQPNGETVALKKNLDLNWLKVKKIGVGLLNLGNNCYLNATLQCLAYTPPLSQWLVSKPHSQCCKFKKSKGFCSLCEVEKIICDIFNSCNGCAKPNSLCINIKSN